MSPMKRILGAFSRIQEKRKTNATNVHTIEHGFEQRGKKRIPFVLKRTKIHEIYGPAIKKIEKWKQTHEKLKQLNLPVSPVFEVYKTKKPNEFTIKQKDYTNGKQKKIKNVQDIRMNESNKEAFIKLVEDTAKMNKKGISVSSKEVLTAPWIFYQKENGEWDRAIIDYGSINTKAPQSSIENNISRLMQLMKSPDVEFNKEVAKRYLKINPNKKIKTLISRTLGVRIN